MTDIRNHPQREPRSPEFEPRYRDREDFPTHIAGPGGKSTITENNERGILDAVVFSALAKHKQAALKADHNSSRQGIYSQDTTYGE